ncbi:MAG: CoA transferase [Holophagales bacterium]|nr:CoA transferase [Holophagales bacterium]MYC10605.1 CoA transferase [Holophagales bacterium]
MHQVLADVRVLDFGRYIAGPFCAALLGDLGAEVIRVEKVRGSEDRFIAPVTPTGEGGMFLQMNRNKRSLTLNPTKPAGREIVKRLVATADVVVANLPPKTLEAMGLDLDSLREVKEDIILTTVSAYGRGGRYSDRVGFDGIGQVMSGIAYMTGDADRPRRAAAPFVDFGTALSCAYGTLAALMARQQTGKGQMVEGALLRTALMMGNANLIEQAVIERNRLPTGNMSQTSGPGDIFRTADGWILCSVIGEPLFRRWVDLMAEDNGAGGEGEEIDWLDDPRFADDLSRGDHGDVIGKRMSAWCASRSTGEAVETLNAAMIPSGPVYSMQQTLDDPHIAEVGSFVPLEYPDMTRPAPVAQPSVRLTETPATIRHRAPTLGEHTDEILGGLGYTADEIAAFRAERVV